MILIDIANNMPSNLPSGVDTAKAISEYGFLAVAAGFFIAASAVQQWLNNRRYDRLLSRMKQDMNRCLTSLLKMVV